MNKKKSTSSETEESLRRSALVFILLFYFRKEDHLRYHPLLQELQAELEGMLQLRH